MIRRIQHIGIAVRNLADAIPFYRDVLGLELVGTEEVADQKIRAAVFRVGESTIEVIESTAPDGPVGKFIEKNGEGIHHLCFEVEDAAAALSHAKGRGSGSSTKRPGRVSTGADRLPPPEVDLRRADGIRAGRGRGEVSVPAPAPSRARPPPVPPQPPAGGELRLRDRRRGARRVLAVPPDPRRFSVGQGDDPLLRLPPPVAGRTVPRHVFAPEAAVRRGQAELLGGGCTSRSSRCCRSGTAWDRSRSSRPRWSGSSGRRPMGSGSPSACGSRTCRPRSKRRGEVPSRDDYHFVGGSLSRRAGRRLPHRIQRRLPARLPGSERLRYLIPSGRRGDAAEIERLTSRAVPYRRRSSPTTGKKFGVWPGRTAASTGRGGSAAFSRGRGGAPIGSRR